MLVSTCCSAAIAVLDANECSYFVCEKCMLPNDGRFVLDLGGCDDAEFQCSEQVKIANVS